MTEPTVAPMPDVGVGDQDDVAVDDRQLARLLGLAHVSSSISLAQETRLSSIRIGMTSLPAVYPVEGRRSVSRS
jgi:hypothetical protein